MGFSDAYSGLSEAGMRQLLLEQMRNDRFAQMGRDMNQAMQTGITGGLNAYQAKLDRDESREGRLFREALAREAANRDEARFGREQQGWAQDDAKVALEGLGRFDEQGMREQLKRKMAEANQYLVDQDKLGESWIEDELRKQESQRYSGLGVDEGWARGQHRMMLDERAHRDTMREYDYADREAGLEGRAVDARAAEARTRRENAVTGELERSGAYPTQRHETVNIQERRGSPDVWQPKPRPVIVNPFRVGGGGGGGGGGRGGAGEGGQDLALIYKEKGDELAVVESKLQQAKRANQDYGLRADPEAVNRLAREADRLRRERAELESQLGYQSDNLTEEQMSDFARAGQMLAPEQRDWISRWEEGQNPEADQAIGPYSDRKAYEVAKAWAKARYSGVAEKAKPLER